MCILVLFFVGNFISNWLQSTYEQYFHALYIYIYRRPLRTVLHKYTYSTDSAICLAYNYNSIQKFNNRIDTVDTSRPKRVLIESIIINLMRETRTAHTIHVATITHRNKIRMKKMKFICSQHIHFLLQKKTQYVNLPFEMLK